MSQKLAGKVAVVTGASKGIGAEIARRLAAEGAAVVVNFSSSKDAGERVAAEIVANGGRAVAVYANMSKQPDIQRLFAETKKAFGRLDELADKARRGQKVLAIPADVSGPPDCEKLVGEAVARLGRLDVLVNNAGIYEFAPLENVTAEHFHRQFDLNVLGLLFASQEAVKQFGKDGGSIVNVSSVVATAAPPNVSVYSATKAAVNAITRSLAQELGPREVRVNSINPGMVETEGLHAAGIAEGDFRRQVESQTPLGRIGKPDDIAPMAVFLASSDSSWITGESFYISGGMR
jgi:3-oxoacyl-[acyl-carrier protein] reductase